MNHAMLDWLPFWTCDHHGGGVGFLKKKTHSGLNIDPPSAAFTLKVNLTHIQVALCFYCTSASTVVTEYSVSF